MIHQLEEALEARAVRSMIQRAGRKHERHRQTVNSNRIDPNEGLGPGGFRDHEDRKNRSKHKPNTVADRMGYFFSEAIAGRKGRGVGHHPSPIKGRLLTGALLNRL